ncbi:MAG TPA: hypothetical protein VKO18_22675 [Terriglobia bacterium]|nr:hypothetical protein [Terriglobia bacterium]
MPSRNFRIVSFCLGMILFLFSQVAAAQFLQLNRPDPVWARDSVERSNPFSLGCDPEFLGGLCSFTNGTNVWALYGEDVDAHLGGIVLWSFPGLGIPEDSAFVGPIRQSNANVLNRLSPAELVFVADHGLGDLVSLDAASGVTIAQRFLLNPNLQCPGDALKTAPVVQLFRNSNKAFQDAINGSGRLRNDLVFEITDYENDCTPINTITALYSDNFDTPRWQFNEFSDQIVGPGRASCTVGYANNTLYCATLEDKDRSAFGTVWAIDTITGARKWEAGKIGSVSISPQIGFGGERVYVIGDEDGRLHALAADGDGKGHAIEIWSLQLPVANGFGPQLNFAVDDRPEDPPWLFVVDGQGMLNRVTDNGNSGHLDWTLQPTCGEEGEGGSAVTAPVFLRGTGGIYVGGSNGGIFEADPTKKDPFTHFFHCPTTGVLPMQGIQSDRSVGWGAHDRLMAVTSGDPGVFRFPIPWAVARFKSDVSVEIVGPSQVSPGETFTYTLTVQNDGPDWATDVTLNESLPISKLLLLNSATITQGEYDQGTGLAHFGDIAPNASASLTISLTNKTPPGQSFTIAGSVAAGEIDPNLGNNTTNFTTTVVGADLSLAMQSTDAHVAPGGSVTYLITVTNTGNVAAPSVSVNDTLSPLFAVVSCTSTGGGTCVGSGNQQQVTFNSLAPQASALITIVAQVSPGAAEGTVIQNIALAAFDGIDDTKYNNIKAVNVAVVGRPSLSGVIVSAVRGAATLTVTLQLTDTGTGLAQNIVIDQVLVSTGTVTFVGPALPSSVGNLAIGSGTTITLTFVLPGTVTKFEVGERGTLQDAVNDTFHWSTPQVITL